MAATILASVVIGEAGNILNDAGAVRWTSSELLGYLNDGAREIATTLIEANSKIVNLQLAAGTKQTLPADTIALIDVKRNMGASGAVPGEAPRRTTQHSLDSVNPNWHNDAPTLVVKNWIYDLQVRGVFYVYPPMSGATYVEIAYGALPAAIASVSSAISIDDIYYNNLLDYVLYRAFAKDAAISGMQARSDAHWAAFARSVTAGHNEAVTPPQ